MTREEFSKLVKGMKSIYADPKFIADQYAFDMWFTLLGDLDYSTVSDAIKTYMMQNSKEPKPADIRAQAVKRSEVDFISPNEAWALVYKALCNSTYSSEEEFNKLPELVQKAVGSPGALRSLASSSDFNEEVEKSHFIRIYDSVVKRSSEEAKLPESIRKAMRIAESEVIGIAEKSE